MHSFKGNIAHFPQRLLTRKLVRIYSIGNLVSIEKILVSVLPPFFLGKFGCGDAKESDFFNIIVKKIARKKFLVKIKRIWIDSFWIYNTNPFFLVWTITTIKLYSQVSFNAKARKRFEDWKNLLNFAKKWSLSNMQRQNTFHCLCRKY